MPCREAFSFSYNNKNDEWHISAGMVSYDKEKQLYTAQDNVELKGGNTRLRAGYLEFSNITGNVIASGNVILKSGNDSITCDSLLLNMNDETGTIYNGVIFTQENHFYIKGDTIQKTGKKTYHADRASLTSCDGEKPDWKISAKEIKITIEGYGTAKGATLWAGNIPALYLPVIAFPAKTKRQTGLLSPRISTSDRKGFEFEQPLFLAISRETDASLYGNYMHKRGIKTALEFRHVQNKESRITILYDYLNDLEIDDGTDATSDFKISSTPQRTNRDRYWFRTKSSYQFSNECNATVDLDYVSDADYMHEFRHGYTGYDTTSAIFQDTFGRGIDEYDDTTRKNSVNINRIWSEYGAAINMGIMWYDDVVARQTDIKDTTLQRAPAITLDTIKQQIGSSPLYFDFDSEYTFMYRKETTTTLVKGYRSDIFPKFYLPIQTDSIFIEPSVGFRQTNWNSSDSGSNFSHREILDINLAMSTTLSKIFLPENSFAERVKHEITPKIEYGYIPEVNQNDLPWFDSTDYIERKNQITWTLTNRFTSRKNALANPGHENDLGISMEKSRNKVNNNNTVISPVYREFAWFEISQSYYLDPEEDQETDPSSISDSDGFIYSDNIFEGNNYYETSTSLTSFDENGVLEHKSSSGHKFSDISAEMELSPYSFLTLKGDIEWSPYDNSFNTCNTQVTLKNPRGDSFFARYGYNNSVSESLYSRLETKLTGSLSAFAIYEQNLINNRTIESMTGLYLNRPCWSMRIAYSDTPDDRAFSFMVNLHGIGEFE
ncbi:LPS-assembly protein LptD [Desulfamplus magnetovallimortis]|nr:LPS assembly protein LptD [Desulfamplus magnetovallimortis]